MTHPLGVVGGHDLVVRWCALAEQRLEYLTEMFESGRWRRYHSERAFLENIREAKVAVETWRGLSTPAPVERSSAVALSLSVPVQAPTRGAIAQPTERGRCGTALAATSVRCFPSTCRSFKYAAPTCGSKEAGRARLREDGGSGRFDCR